jgi:hypothetical protein
VEEQAEDVMLEMLVWCFLGIALVGIPAGLLTLLRSVRALALPSAAASAARACNPHCCLFHPQWLPADRRMQIQLAVLRCVQPQPECSRPSQLARRSHHSLQSFTAVLAVLAARHTTVAHAATQLPFNCAVLYQRRMLHSATDGGRLGFCR